MINEKNTYSISEVAERTGFKPHVIRFYEKEFNINIPRSKNNRRYFTINEIEILLHIQQLQSEGFNNKQIKNILNNQIDRDTICSSVNDEIAITTEAEVNATPYDSYTHNSITADLKNEIIRVLEKYNYRKEIEEIKKKVEELSDQLNYIDRCSDENTDKDVLICENAKLKLKIKEKSYEIAELKDKLKRQEHQKTSIFQKLLKTKSV